MPLRFDGLSPDELIRVLDAAGRPTGLFVSANEVRHAPVWDDVTVPLTQTKLQGANVPTFSKLIDDGAGSEGIFAYSWSKTAEQSLQFHGQLPHRWYEGSSLHFHAHWAPSTSAAGNVVLGIEYVILSVDDAIPANSTLVETTIAANGAIAQQIDQVVAISGTGHSVSAIILARFFRNGAAAADTYDAPCWIFDADFHIQVDGSGSVAEYTK